MSKLLKSKFLLGVVAFAIMFVGVVAVSNTASAASCSITTTLRVGSRGEEVKCLQAALDQGLVGDGVFGPKTKARVVAWQASVGLVADGVFGAKSRAAWMGSMSVTYPAGCTSGTGYSSTTGQPCTATTVTTSYPAGCTSSSGFSSTTGQPCSATVVVPTSGAVSVSLASDNPASGTLLIDDALVMQNAAPIAKFVFSNGTSAPVNVNTVKLTRTGIASDGDINNLYLYEGTTKLAELSSVTTKVFAFNSSAGLFTIPANSSKAIWVGVNMTPDDAGATSVGFSINSSADVVLSNGTTAGGSFPVNGNQFSTAFISDLGYTDIGTVTTYPSTLDPKPESQELWRIPVTANSQDMAIKRIVLTMVGTIAPGDIQDLTLSVAGVQVGATSQLGTDNKVVFDWAATPYKILSGQSKTFVLMGKVVKGTGRAFKFTIRSTADFVSTDTNYGVDTTPTKSGSALTVVEPTSGTGTSINSGTLTISRSATSPSGNIASGGIDTVLARFDYKASGEDIKVSYVRITLNQEGTDSLTWNEGKLYFNGSQVGTTFDLVDETVHAFSLGNTVIIPAGTTGVFELRSNVEQSTGTDIAADQTVVVSLSGTSGDAIGQTTFTSITPASASSQTLTVKSGTLTAAKNTSVADATTVNPTGVKGATNVKVGSVVLTAGAGEAVNVTQIVVGDDPADGTSDFGDNFQNLTLRHGSSTSTPIATVQGTLSGDDGADYTFALSPSVTISAGAQYVVDFYADILTGAATYSTAEIGLEFVSAAATGVNTSADASYSTVQNLQNVVISATGSLVITANASTPVAGQLVMGDSGQTFAMLDFAAGSGEDVNVSVITISNGGTFAGSLSNIKLYDGATLLGTVASFDAQSSGVATFNLASDWVIPRNTTKTLTVKADVNSYGSAVSGGSQTLSLASNSNVTSRGAQSGTDISETVTTATGTAQIVYRTKPIVSLASTTPSGSQTVGSNKDVLEFNVAANSAYDVVVNAVAVTMSGSLTGTSSGNAVLYKSTDLSTALATEAYVQDTSNVSATTTSVTGSAGDWNGIPVGATVTILDASVGSMDTNAEATKVKVTLNTGTVLTYTPASASDGGTDVTVSYRPLQPGTGKLFFGAQSTTTGTGGALTIASGATATTVASTDGFAPNDTLALVGYNATGSTCTGTGTITSLSATVITASGGITVTCAAGTNTIATDYLSATSSVAIANNQNGVAIARTGRINTSGQTVTAGTTVTFVVKGDTTSTGTSGTTANLEADIAAVGDFIWDDKTSYGITTVTKNIPITGGTLTYTY